MGCFQSSFWPEIYLHNGKCRTTCVLWNILLWKGSRNDMVMKSDIWLLAKEMWEIVMLPAILGSYQGTRACCSLHQSATKFFIHLFYLLFECFISGWLRLIYSENSYNRNKFYITSLIHWGMSLNAACFSSGFFLWHSNINKYFQSSLFTDFCTNWFIPFKNSRVKIP